MGEIAPLYAKLPAATEQSRADIQGWTNRMRELPQLPFVTRHKIHGGVYTRGITVPPKTMFTGVLLKMPTTLIIAGSIDIYVDENTTYYYEGYNELVGSAGRQCGFYTHTTVGMWMVLATKHTTVEEVQAEFTDQLDMLVPLSNTEAHHIVITGE